MNMEGQGQQDMGTEFDREPSNSATRNDQPVSDAVAARSKENVSQWISYLPRACINAMVKMGWDKTT
jgi:hypothetical protein